MNKLNNNNNNKYYYYYCFCCCCCYTYYYYSQLCSHQSCTALNESSLVTSYMRMNPIAPR